MTRYVHAVVGKKKFRIQFEDGRFLMTSTGLLMFILAEEEVGKMGEDRISDLPKKVEGELSIIDGDPIFE